MKALRIIFVFFLLVLLAGCAKDNVWNKPGASSDDLSKTRYACIQQSRQGPGSASFFVESNSHSRSYGGSDHVFVFNNPQIFDACMNAAGWNLQAQGAPLSSQPRQQNVVETAMAPQNTSDPMRALCTDPAYQEYFAQSPCPADEDHASQGTEPSTSIVPEKSSLEEAKIHAKVQRKMPCLFNKGTAFFTSGRHERVRYYGAGNGPLTAPLFGSSQFLPGVNNRIRVE